MRFTWDPKKSEKLKNDKSRRCSLEDAEQVFYGPWLERSKNDDPEQFLAIGYVSSRLISVVFERREDFHGEYFHLVTLWKSTKEERKSYEEEYS